jgi:hypothetical protein
MGVHVSFMFLSPFFPQEKVTNNGCPRFSRLFWNVLVKHGRIGMSMDGMGVSKSLTSTGLAA